MATLTLERSVSAPAITGTRVSIDHIDWAKGGGVRVVWCVCDASGARVPGSGGAYKYSDDTLTAPPTLDQVKQKLLDAKVVVGTLA